MQTEWWEIVKDAGIPVAAIIVSSLVAVWLARTERKAAVEARREERLDIAAERVLFALSPFISIDPVAEDWSTYLRTFRSSVMLYEAAAVGDKDATVVGEWLANEWLVGFNTFLGVMMRLSEDDRDNLIARTTLASPGHEWAGRTTALFAGWLKRKVPLATIRARSEELQAKLESAASSAPRTGYLP